MTFASLRTASVAAFALLFPAVCVAQTVAFDRNGNGVPDVRFEQVIRHELGHGILFDNDENGKSDFGFLGIVIGNSGDLLEFRSLWIDKNGDGTVGKKEVMDLKYALPWATFPMDYGLNALSGKGTYFMDYTYDNLKPPAQEIGNDTDGDGDLERDALMAIGEGNSDGMAIVLLDKNNDGYYDTVQQVRAGSGELLLETFISKQQQRHLPVLKMPLLP
jgi:hypothetical protein